MMYKPPTRVSFLLLMVCSMIAWGGAWTSAKAIAGMTSPQVLVFWRYLFTALSFIPILLIRKESFKLESRPLFFITMGALFMVAYSQFFFQGLITGLAGAGGVLVTTLNPLFTYAITALIFRKRIHKKEALGLSLGVIGGVTLLQLWEFNFHQLLLSGNLYFLLAALTWVFVAISSQEAQKSTTVFTYSFYINGIAALLDFFFAYKRGVFEVFSFPPLFWFNIFYLSIIATTFGTTAYFFCTQKLGASKASSFIFLVPVNAVILSMFFLQEKVHWTTIVGGSLAFGAVYLINKKSQR